LRSEERLDTSLVFAVVAAIIMIAFAGEFFFKKTGIPIFIFLILTGIILGPVLNFIPGEPLVPIMPIFAELTLMLILFHGGMGLKSDSVLPSGARAFIQTLIYVFSSIALITATGIFILRWDVLSSLIFASMIGGETTAAVIVPLSKSMKLREATTCFLTIESAMNSIFSIVLFFAFVGVFNTGSTNWLDALYDVGTQFSVGIALGAVLSFAWVFLLHLFRGQKFTYVLTLGLVLFAYSLTTKLGGNGIIAVLVFGIILGNYTILNRLFKTKINIDSLQKQLASFQEEISFLLESLFFVFLGLTFVIKSSPIASNLSIGILILVILLATRFVATKVSTFKSELSRERRTIWLMCPQGLTPATLAILAVSFQLPLADTYLNIAIYVIILTNIVTTIGSFLRMRR
jgi:cell volume regulation protein A